MSSLLAGKMPVMDEMFSRFRTFTSDNGLVRAGDKIILSLSAGKDSMFMLTLMSELRNEIEIELAGFHLNHLTRGLDSDRDEEFVKEQCRRYGIECYTERYDFKDGRPGGLSFEEHARDIRYSMLKYLAQSIRYGKIATAHNMNDNAETLLMRILSGTGIIGLAGIQPTYGNIIRPVLYAGQDEIYSYLKEHKIQWREDSSNKDNSYLRNYLRNKIIPEIKTRFPEAEKSLNLLAGHASENRVMINRFVREHYPRAVSDEGNAVFIDTESLNNDIPLLKFIIAEVMLKKYSMKMKVSIFAEIFRRFQLNTANMNLYRKDLVSIDKIYRDGVTYICISGTEEKDATAKEWEYEIDIDSVKTVRIEEIKKEVRVSVVSYDYYIKNRENPEALFLQPETDLKLFKIRNRRNGDRIKLERGSKKIKELMIEKKLDIKRKNIIPILETENQVAAYLPGLINIGNNRLACNFHIRDDTKRILAFFFTDC